MTKNKHRHAPPKEAAQIREIRESWLYDRSGKKFVGEFIPWRKGPDRTQEMKAIENFNGKFPQICGLARVPQESIASLGQAITSDLEREWWEYRESASVGKYNPVLRQLRRLKQMSLGLRAALEACEPAAILQLRVIYALSGKTSLECANDLDLLADFPKRAESALDHVIDQRKISCEKNNVPKSRGRPVGGALSRRGPGSLAAFSLRLNWDVKAAGGRLTFDKNSGTGTFLDVLKLLQPSLPPNFIPNVLPLSTLATVKALDKKMRF